jgi:hypothetical protein
MTKAKKKLIARKRQPRKKATNQRRPYTLPKTAAELGIVCSTCGAPSVWFDYELGEKNFYAGIVCDAHRVSERVEKLAV